MLVVTFAFIQKFLLKIILIFICSYFSLQNQFFFFAEKSGTSLFKPPLAMSASYAIILLLISNSLFDITKKLDSRNQNCFNSTVKNWLHELDFNSNLLLQLF